MKYKALAAATCLFLGPGVAFSLAQSSPQNPENQNGQPGMEAAAGVTATATVQDIDHQNRTVTLKGQSGNTFTVKVGPEAKNFNRIQKGDQVTFHYVESLALAVRKVNEPPSADEQQMVMRAQPGQMPAGAAIERTQVTATVQNIDRNKREVTLRLPDGKTKTLKVGKDIEAFDRLQPGDQVAATYTEAISIDVTNPSK